MMSYNSALENVRNRMELGQLDALEANAEIIRLMGVKLITSKIPKQVRSYLNLQVKEGKLGHLKKEGHRPEAYFHKNAKARAIEERDKYAVEALEALSKVCV